VLIVWKGGSSKIKLTSDETIGVIFGVGGAVTLLVSIIFLPYLYRKVVLDDWQLHWWHIPLGPLLLRRGEVPPKPEGRKGIQDYYSGHMTREELEAKRAGETAANSEDVEKHPKVEEGKKNDNSSEAIAPNSPEIVGQKHKISASLEAVYGRPGGPWYTPAILFWHAKRAFFHGVEKDVISLQSKRNLLSGDGEDMHARAAHYDNKVEYMYSFLQVLTAATASFTHGANDVSK
jgi:solute carrier family 20 (sodium-dependent phosphate transporter)